MASACRVLGSTKITLSTGTRDEQDLWRGHPDNNTAEAWRELLYSIEAALAITEPEGVVLLVEPEPGNVMSDANRARQLLDEVRSPRLKILFDAANLLSGHSPVDQRGLLDKAFDLLGPDIALAHGKEWLVSEESDVRVPGRGRLDWDYYLRSLAQAGYAGPLILHGFDEAAAGDAVEFVRSKLSGTCDAQGPAKL
jgi:sugar phosphate isomerase/epimerase